MRGRWWARRWLGCGEGLEADFAVEDGVGLEIPGEDEEDDHGGGGPTEETDGEGGGERGAVRRGVPFGGVSSLLARLRGRLGVAEEEAGGEGDAGGGKEKGERVQDAVFEGGGGDEEGRVEDSVERQDEKQEGGGFDEIDEHREGSSLDV
jgi:hypothetical protein